MKQKFKPYFVYPSVAVLALYASALGSMIPAIRAAFPGLTLAGAGLFSTLQSLGTMISVILCFCVFSALNKARIMTVFSFVFAGFLFIFGVNNILFLLYVLLLFIGISTNVVDTLSIAIVADLTPGRKGFHIGMMQALWAAFGIAGPYLSFVFNNQYPPVFFTLGAVMTLSALALLLGLSREARLPLLQQKHNFGTIGKLIRTLKRRGFKTLVAASFFNSVVQISIIFFMSSYVITIRNNSFDGVFALSMVFVGSLIGRVAYAKLSHRLSARAILVPGNLLAMASYAAMLLCQDAVLAAVFAGLGGIGIASNFPAFVVEACQIIPDDTSAATALVFLGYAVACFVAPPVIGAVGDAAGLQVALLCSIAILIPVAALSSRLKRQPTAFIDEYE